MDNKTLDVIDVRCNHEDVNSCRGVVALENTHFAILDCEMPGCAHEGALDSRRSTLIDISLRATPHAQ